MATAGLADQQQLQLTIPFSFSDVGAVKLKYDAVASKTSANALTETALCIAWQEANQGALLRKLKVSTMQVITEWQRRVQ